MDEETRKINRNKCVEKEGLRGIYTLRIYIRLLFRHLSRIIIIIISIVCYKIVTLA